MIVFWFEFIELVKVFFSRFATLINNEVKISKFLEFFSNSFPILPFKHVFSRWSELGSSSSNSGWVLLVNLLKEQLLKVESKFADRQTNENSFKHLSSQSERFAAVISFMSETGSFSFFLGYLSNTYLRLGHSLSGRFAVVGSLNKKSYPREVLKLTCKTNFREMDAVGNQHEVSDAFWNCLLSGEITSRLFVFRISIIRRYPTSRLEIEARACSN